MNELQKLYVARAEKFQTTAQSLKAKYNNFSLIRLICFVAGTGAVVFLWTTFGMLAGAFSIAVFLFAFAKFVRWHLAIQRLQKHCEALSQINRNEGRCLRNDYSALQDGAEFIDPHHPYAIDLDIFGAFSFFQFCNRTSTAIGKRRLANYLQAPAEKEVILERQNALAELKDKLNWRQDFQAYGRAANDDIRHLEALEKWLNRASFVLGNKWLRMTLYAAPIWTIISLFLFIFHLPWQLAILLLIPPGLVLQKTVSRVNQTHEETTHAEKILAHYARLIGHIEKENFSSEMLSSLQKVFFQNEKNAAAQMIRLSYIIRQLNVRHNFFAIFLNISVLWDLRYVYQLEKWKAGLKDHLPEWFHSLEEFEALLSLATLHFNNPEWRFPLIHEQPVLVAEALGHPLIPRESRVCNDLEIFIRSHIKLVTGSNMAGKSTFLRTVGLNIVLAMAGAPVCARKLKLPLLRVYTSMRTQDALHESTSSFYAELKRLKFIIDSVEKRDNIFFLLDEILKGTNSNDRHAGSKALIKQLIKSNGAGIVATHDLELGKLETTAEGAIENLCMEVDINENELFFDYKLRKGVSQSFNATLLMKNMGIQVGEE